MDLPEIIRENKFQILIGFVGFFLMGMGLFQGLSQVEEDSKVEIISSDKADGIEDISEVVVDVSGSVVNPGVYQLSSGARINNALIAAGGLAAEADRGWVSRFINLAAKVQDGMKIYIPLQGEGNIDSKNSKIETDGQVVGLSGGVNINMATVNELDALWGIGEKRAQTIIDNRPYSEIRELVSKAGIPSNVFERIKDSVSVY